MGKRQGLTTEQKKIVVRIRNTTDKGYGEIAEMVGADSRYQVRSFLKTKGAINLGLDIDKRAMTGNGKSYEAREEHFGNLFNSLHPTFKYHSGYKNATELFKCECLECGHVQERSAEMVRPSYTDYNLQCDGCLEVERNEREKERQKDMALKRLGRTLLRIEDIRKKKQDRIDYLTSLANHTCSECGDTFTATSKGTKYCGRRCASRVHDRTKKVKKRLRAEANGAVDTITLDELIIKDGNECYLCGEECNRNDYVISDEGHFIVGRTYPSIDHVMPVAKGGTHTWDNVRLAHHHCNTIKSDNIIEEVLQMA